MSNVTLSCLQPASSNDWDALQDAGQPYGEWGNRALPRAPQSTGELAHRLRQFLLRPSFGDNATVESGPENEENYQPDFLATLLLVAETVAAAAPTSQKGCDADEDGSALRPCPWHLFRNSEFRFGINRLGTNNLSREFDGSGVIVGVIDTGFNIQHEIFSHVNFFDDATTFYSDYSDISNSDHGTAVASLIFGLYAPKHACTEDFGSAPRATMMPFATPLTLDLMKEVADTHKRAATSNIDVLNFSWGFPNIFADSIDNPNRSHNSFVPGGPGSTILASFEEATRNGRGGKGIILVTSAGNKRRNGDDINTHDLKKSPYIIAVGAIDKNGKIAPFSTPGSAIFLVAPGQDVPAAKLEVIQDSQDSSNNSYASTYSTQSGTSFAAPLVSGVAATILQANPDLGWRDVHEILAAAAFPLDLSHKTWSFNSATDWNGGGRLFSNDFGFGLVDQHASVRLAETWFLATDSSSALKSDSLKLIDLESSPFSRSQQEAIFTFSFDDDLRVERAYVDMAINIQSPRNIRIELVSPTGTRSTLLDDLGRPRGASESGPPIIPGHLPIGDEKYIDWNEKEAQFRLKLYSNMFRGENANGTWKLIISTDNGSKFSVRSEDVHLKFYGAHDNVVHRFIFTDSFSEVMEKRHEFETLFFENLVTLDTRGENTIDVINAAAVSSSIFFDLENGGIIDGVRIGVNPGSTFEGLAAGDGNDVLIGSQDDNHLWGGRGNDLIYYRGGNDVVFGGMGLDTVVLQGRKEIWRSWFNEFDRSVLMHNLETGDWVSLYSVEHIVFDGRHKTGGLGS